MPTTDDQEHTLALTRDLIACASVTPEDAGCQSLMMTRLQQAGFSVECASVRLIISGQPAAHPARCWCLPDTLTWYLPETRSNGNRIPLSRPKWGLI